MFAKWSTPSTAEVTAEVDGARCSLGIGTDEILLAALGRAIARTIGDGVLAVDVVSVRRVARGVPVLCATGRQASATDMVADVHRQLALLPPVRVAPLAEVFLNCVGNVPDEAPALRRPPSDHALELRAYRTTGLLHLDWWYDTRRFDPYTIEELAEQFPLAVIEMTSDAVAIWSAG